MTTTPPEADIIDLDLLAYQDQFTYRVVDPRTGKPTTWAITFAGPGHPQTLATEESELRKLLSEQEAQQEEQLAAVKAKQPVPKFHRTVAEERSRRAAWVAARILSSTPARLNGEEIRLNPNNAAEILARPELEWLLNQCNAALGNRENFLRPSART